MFLKKVSYRFLIFTFICALFLGLFVLAGFKSYPVSTPPDILYIASQWVMIFIAVWGFVGLLALNKYIFAVAYPIPALFCSILGYFAFTTNTVFTVMILDATIHNDWQTSADFVHFPLIATIIFALIISIAFVYIRFKKIRSISISSRIICSVFFIAAIVMLNTLPATKRLIANHIPYNIYYVTANYIEENKSINQFRESLSENSECEADSLTVIFVIGESLRADHLGLNGYTRNTTPKLSALENITSLPNVYSKYTYTNISLPHIMTRSDTINEDIAYQERSFIDIFKACGFETSWLANQESAYTYVYFMNEADTLIFTNPNKSSYTFDKWLDEDLIPHYLNCLKQEKEKKLVILHTIGSHWWYNSHYTDEFAKFRPVIKSKIISSNTGEEMINSYDNTILYTDNFLANLIEPLKDQNAILIYLSDHGESLGENGKWLHAVDNPPVHYPASFVWLSDTYIDKYPEKQKALTYNKGNRITTGYLFHSILDGALIKTPYLDKKSSIFNITSAGE